MDIEASRQAVSSLPITVPVLTSLRESARLILRVVTIIDVVFCTLFDRFSVRAVAYIHIRTVLNLCKKWVDNDFIIQHGNANKSRKYELADKWLELV